MAGVDVPAQSAQQHGQSRGQALIPAQGVESTEVNQKMGSQSQRGVGYGI